MNSREVKVTIDKPTITANERKATPIYQGVVKYFPLAIAEIAKLSLQGNIQHGLGEDGELVWQKDISNDHLDCLMRHLCDYAGDKPIDEDGISHDIKVAWRALAHLQIRLENDR